MGFTKEEKWELMREQHNTGALNSRLRQAIHQGNLEDARALLAHGAQLESRDMRGCTPLILAVQAHQENLALFLLNEGANPSARDNLDRTVLYWAVTCHNTALVRALLQTQVDPNEKCIDGNTALHKAAFEGDCASAAALIAHGARVNATNRFGRTPLHMLESSTPAGRLQAHPLFCLLCDAQKTQAMVPSLVPDGTHAGAQNPVSQGPRLSVKRR